MTYIADDAEYTNIPMGTVRGPAGVRTVLVAFFAPIHESEFIVLPKAAADSVVFLERLDRHRLDHGWRELPSTASSRCTTARSLSGATTSTLQQRRRSTCLAKPESRRIRCLP